MEEQIIKQNPEILAPVGTEGSLEAAVYAGADAVYFGSGACNARRNAGQFTGKALTDAVRFCHAYGVKVHVTVNTLVRDEERKSVADTLSEIASAGADAIIVQDLTVMRLAKQICPELSLHASTQIAVHNAAGVLQLEDLGFSRVVLARELSIEEIRAIRERTHTELECFIHGALCMSASGMCYLSAMLGERSGNRGLCAQPCRLPFVCNGADYALSLKDMSHIAHYSAYRDAGVSSLKIEGRLKSPEYVAAAVDAVRRVRDGEPYSEDVLKDVFSRGGFTDGYYTGHRNHTMFGVRTQEDAKRAQAVLSGVRELYRMPKSRVPVTLSMTVEKDRNATLQASDGVHSVVAEGPVAEPAIRVSLSEESVGKNLGKTGGTPFYIKHTSYKIDDRLMLPASAINSMRRDALDALYEARAGAVSYTVREADLALRDSKRRETPRVCVRYASFSQWREQTEIAWFSLPVAELIAHKETITDRTVAEIPALVYPHEESKVRDMLKELRDSGVRYALCENIGAILIAKNAGLIPIGGYGLNVTNSDAIDAYRALGAAAQFVSFELSAPKIRDLSSTIPLGMIVAGRLPLMQLRSCPARSERGCGACDGHPVLTDRKNAVFPLLCSNRGYSTMLNSVPLYLADKQLPSIDYYAVYLTTETAEQAQDLIRSVYRKEPYTGEHTTGLAFRNLL